MSGKTIMGNITVGLAAQLWKIKRTPKRDMILWRLSVYEPGLLVGTIERPDIGHCSYSKQDNKMTDKMIYVWVAIFMAIALGGTEDGTFKKYIRWVTMLIVSALLILYFK